VLGGAQLPLQSVAYFDAHRGLYRAVRNMSGSMQAFDALLGMLTTIARPLLENHPRLPVDVDPATAARWLGGGAFNLLDGWICGESTVKPHELAGNLHALLPNWFRLE
jgi:hypothetical protein